jgi:hypothetical protein
VASSAHRESVSCGRADAMADPSGETLLHAGRSVRICGSGGRTTQHEAHARRTAELQCPTTAFDRLIGIARYNSRKESSSHSHPFKVDSDCCRGMFGERARGSRGSLGLGLSAENSLSVVVAGWNSISAIVAIRSLRHKHSEGHNDVSSTAPLCAANSRGSLACAREGVDSTFGSG